MFCLFAPQTIGIFRNPNPEIWLGFIEIHLCFDILKAGFSKELFVLPHHCVNPEMDVKQRRGKWLQDNREMFEKKGIPVIEKITDGEENQWGIVNEEGGGIDHYPVIRSTWPKLDLQP